MNELEDLYEELHLLKLKNCILEQQLDLKVGNLIPPLRGKERRDKEIASLMNKTRNINQEKRLQSLLNLNKEGK